MDSLLLKMIDNHSVLLDNIYGVKVITFNRNFISDGVIKYFTNNTILFDNNIFYLKLININSYSFFEINNKTKLLYRLDCKNDNEFKIHLRKIKLLNLND